MFSPSHVLWATFLWKVGSFPAGWQGDFLVARGYGIENSENGGGI